METVEVHQIVDKNGVTYYVWEGMSDIWEKKLKDDMKKARTPAFIEVEFHDT